MRLISSNDIAGQLARWAVTQHPYHAPDGLFELVQEVLGLCRRDFKDGVETLPMRWFESCNDICRWLKEALGEEHATLKLWNTRRNKRHGHGFVSRYDGPSPEDDFIDIDALLGNVAMGAWRDAEEHEKAA